MKSEDSLPKRKDITGQKYGKLTALRCVGVSKHRKSLWLCRCECGGEKVVVLGDLTSGRTQSCGCKYSEARSVDLTGQRFGKLVAIKRTEKQTDVGSWIWICKCDCGNTHEVSNSSLVSGNTKSCGCLKKEIRNAMAEDFTGKKYGEYEVIERAWEQESYGSGPIWRCKCSCGNKDVFKTPYELKNDMLIWCWKCRSKRQSEYLAGRNNPRWNGYNAKGIPNYDNYAPQIEFAEEVRRKKTDPNVLEVKCRYCRKWFTPTVDEVQRRIKALNDENFGTENNLYCSIMCKRKCPTYRRRVRSKVEDRPYRKDIYRTHQNELRLMVLERDEYTCVRCGKSQHDYPELKLVCHHIEGVEQNPVESADMDLCVTVCEECDDHIHKQPGCRRIDFRCK